MTGKIKDKKVTGVGATKNTREVEGTDAVGTVKQVKATEAVSGVGGTAAIGKRKATRTLTADEREQLMKLVQEEADKLFAEGGLPAKHKELVTTAVKMTLGAGAIEEDTESSDPKKPRRS